MHHKYSKKTKLLKWKSKVLVKMQRLIQEKDINLSQLSRTKRELNQMLNQ